MTVTISSHICREYVDDLANLIQSNYAIEKPITMITDRRGVTLCYLEISDEKFEYLRDSTPAFPPQIPDEEIPF